MQGLKRVAMGLYGLIPEGGLRHGLRRLLLAIRPQISKRFYVNPGDTVLQVGAPSPGLIRWYLDIVGPQGRVVIVEPEKANHDRLLADPQLKNSPRLTTVKRAAWSSKTPLDLVVSQSRFDHKVEVPEIIHDNDLVPDNYVGTERVQADTVDNIASEIGLDRIDYAEVHVNGAEIEVLKGMTGSMERTRRIHVKGHAVAVETKEPINETITRMLRDAGFRTILCKDTVARSEAKEWGRRAGDVYGGRV